MHISYLYTQGVIGLGGLGHMAVKFLVSFGVNVTVISRSNAKEDEAKKELGATHFLNSAEKDQMTAAMGTLDFIIDTAPGRFRYQDTRKLQ
jgi:uncharacterized zinc-type alcohol dehydrogenase-like protein